MLVLLSPEQVAKDWAFIAPAIAQALPPTAVYKREGMTNLLRAVLLEKATVWAYYHNDEIQAFCVTQFVYDEIIGQKNLLIYALASVGKLERYFFDDGIETLRKYSAGKGCSKILAYSSNPSVIKLVQKLLNGKTNFTLLEI